MSKKVAIDNALKVFAVFFLIGSDAVIGAFGTLLYSIAYNTMIRCQSKPSSLCPNYNLILANDLKIVVIGSLVLIVGIILVPLVSRRRQRTNPEEPQNYFSQRN